MNSATPYRVFAGMQGDTGIASHPAFRVGLLLVATALFLLVWLLPATQPMRSGDGWFPVSLHTAAETFSIVVSVMVFAVSWHAYRPERPGNIIILACAFLGTALLDFAHMLSYPGMPGFITPSDPQKSIAFWLCARLLSALALLLIAFRSWQPFTRPGQRYAWMFGILALVALVYLLQLGFPQAWPRFFIPGQGLTPIKVALESLVVLIMLVVVIRVWRARVIDPPYDVAGMLTAALLWMLSELCLTLYSNVNDVFSLLGHVYKVLAYLFLYRLAFVASVREPYQRLAVEIADKQAAQAQVEVLAFYDLLTGLPNKALLRDRVHQILAARQIDHGQCALLLLNVDGFQGINDSLGHAHGDGVLRAISERLPRCLDESDTVSRIGSDEFAVVLREVRDGERVAATQERIMAALADPMQVLGEELRMTVSIGVALAPADGSTFEALFEKASTALHRAKEAGGNCWRFYSSGMHDDVSERLRLRHGLRHALERGEFVLHYQPQFALGTRALVGVEALIRWQHPELGLRPPQAFIGEAEQTGLIVPIGSWILHQACRQTKVWRDAGLQVPRVAVNLSARQFQHGELERDVLDALAESGLPATALELELTESILIQDAEAALHTVRNLKALGVSLSIDDFGTGYSSLAYLRHFPVDKLKIDQSFVRDLGQRADAEVMISTIIQLARSFGLSTIAEGVEDAAAASTLLRLGCAEAQGFHFARPLPADALEALLRDRPAAG